MAQRYAYQLVGLHYRKAWRYGDLEAELINLPSEIFYTRKAGNERLIELKNEASKKGFETRIELISRGDKSSQLTIITGDEWINENSGEKCVEYISYSLDKKYIYA